MSIDDIQHPFPHDLLIEKTDNQEEFEDLNRMLNLIQQSVEETGLVDTLNDSWQEEYLFEMSDEIVFLTIPRDNWNRILTEIFNANQGPLVHPDDWAVIKEIHQEFMEQNTDYSSNQWTAADEEGIPPNYESYVVYQ